MESFLSRYNRALPHNRKVMAADSYQTDFFRVTSYTTPTSHLRQYPRATAQQQEDVLHISVKRYTPLDNPTPGPGDVSFIAAHANGVPKEMYEPLWDELYKQLKEIDVELRIRNIWIADVAWQGESSVLNEGRLGDEPSWYDHTRDLLHFVNTFRAELPRPIIGIGHSMGGCQIVQLALMHPRLLQAVMLIDPVIMRSASARSSHQPAYMSTFRRDIWPSREAAADSFRKNKFYQTWDPRCLDRWIQYGLRELPTTVYPEYPADASPSSSEPTKPVTLRTPKHLEVLTFLRPNYPPRSEVAPRPGEDALADYRSPQRVYPDLPGSSAKHVPFYRPEAPLTFAQLPHLRPRCLYVFANESWVNDDEAQRDKMEVTGRGLGGSRASEGVALEPRESEEAADGVSHDEAHAPAVQDIVIQGAGHFVAFEKPTELAQHAAAWLRVELRKWRRDEARDARDADRRASEFGKASADEPGYRNREAAMLSPLYVDWMEARFGDQLGRKKRKDKQQKL